MDKFVLKLIIVYSVCIVCILGYVHYTRYMARDTIVEITK